MNPNKESILVKISVFVSGCVLMAIEISGSRILSPYFGNTIFLWASLIGVLLTALAIGNLYGGKLADKNPSYIIWSHLFAIAGLFTLAIPFISGTVNRTIVNFDIADKMGSLIASTVIFFGPSVLLGMISPFAIKFNIKNMSDVGITAGNLYAISTAGNIFGTLFTAFYLINKMKVSSIFTLLGLTLIITAMVIFLFLPKRRFIHYLFFTIFFFVSLVLVIVPPPPLISLSKAEVVVFQKDSFYNHIIVTDDKILGIRRLRFDKYDQTAILLSGNYGSVHNTTDMMHLPFAFSKQPKKILFIGGGGAVVPRNYHNDHPDIEIDVVEIDPVVSIVSQEYFYFTPQPRLRLITEDGRRFIQKTKQKYDIVIIDAFNTKGMVPFHMLTKEFLLEIQQILRPEGVIAYNIISSVYGSKPGLFLSLYKTLQSVFHNIYAFPNVIYDENIDYRKTRNIILIADNSPIKLTQEQLYKHFSLLVNSGKIKVLNLADYAKCYLDIKPSALDNVSILTDDYAPAEILSSREYN